MNEQLEEQLKYLRLSGLRSNWDRYMEIAQKGNFSHTRMLTYIIEQEYKIKKENARKMRLKRARIPEIFAMETYPFEKQPKLKKKKILALYDSFDYMTHMHNIIWIGQTGTGKTGLATAFLAQAIDKGHTGLFVLFPDLVRELHQSEGDHSEKKVLKKYYAPDCLLVDELGYVEVESSQVGLLFTLMHWRHKKKTTLITSNLGFQEWTTFLMNRQLTAAFIDRLTENSHVINMKECVSLRPKPNEM
jgi:DNA replication protein DnaC